MRIPIFSFPGDGNVVQFSFSDEPDDTLDRGELVIQLESFERHDAPPRVRFRAHYWERSKGHAIILWVWQTVKE